MNGRMLMSDRDRFGFMSNSRKKKLMRAQASIRMQRHSGLEGSTQRNLKRANTITVGFDPLVFKIIFIIG